MTYQARYLRRFGAGFVALCVGSGLAHSARTLAQSQTPTPAPAFEVTSVKPNNSGDNRIMIGMRPGGRYTTVGTTLKQLMASAYRVRDFQVLGGPGWIGTDRFDIEGKAEEGIELTPDTMNVMLQGLLADRFKLKVHREMRELPVYELSVARDGPKMKAVPAPERPSLGARGAVGAGVAGPPTPPARGAAPPPGSIQMTRGGVGSQLAGSGMQITNLTQLLSQQLGRPVIDKTGLTGYYDFSLTWTPEGGGGGGFLGGGPAGGPAVAPPAADLSGPSIFTAVQEQLGLKLDSAKGPVEHIVIDSVAKPEEN